MVLIFLIHDANMETGKRKIARENLNEPIGFTPKFYYMNYNNLTEVRQNWRTRSFGMNRKIKINDASGDARQRYVCIWLIVEVIS
jgi:hypothetical protein